MPQLSLFNALEQWFTTFLNTVLVIMVFLTTLLLIAWSHFIFLQHWRTLLCKALSNVTTSQHRESMLKGKRKHKFSCGRVVAVCLENSQWAPGAIVERDFQEIDPRWWLLVRDWLIFKINWPISMFYLMKWLTFLGW